ncbi:hypothetical protein [Corynebacterium sp.]|uniref:hypothetical protein n=1 Tax=Corynebacterium sp. TaxID=1720 RepID=UPI0026DF207B|nr:hypothetical protein [Corynebacterium sp.]MDO5513532.1 hypothetical protein [Corynebacterium sp.]
MRRRLVVPLLFSTAASVLVACADDTDAPAPASPESAAADSQEYPDILEAELTASGDEFRISVTVSSPYDTPERYADGWRVLTPEGDVLAEHDLAHDHQNEQPFTRSRGPFAIPDDVDEVVVEGRDQDNGYGGDTVTVPVPR